MRWFNRFCRPKWLRDPSFASVLLTAQVEKPFLNPVGSHFGNTFSDDASEAADAATAAVTAPGG